MPDNPQHASTAFRLPEIRVLDLEGRDAADFAQSQFMNDVATLPDGHWQWNGWLSPKGRVVALFALLRLDASHIRLVLPDTDPDALAARLRTFVFRKKTAFVVPGAIVAGALEGDAMAEKSRIAVDGDRLSLDFGVEGQPRTLRFLADARDDAAAADVWRAADLEAGLPRLDASGAERWTPQQLSLERLGAFSVKKGCYPGQEIVARTHFLGQAKRGLALFDADRPVAPGTAVHGDGTPWGEVVSTAPRVGRHLVLAVGPRESAPGTVEANGVALHARPLREGLAR